MMVGFFDNGLGFSVVAPGSAGHVKVSVFIKRNVFQVAG
jgi:hypothetical protein